MRVKGMINDPRIWAGQNRPGLPMKDADIVMFSVPYDGGVSFRAGAAEGPKAIREITYTIAPTLETFESIDGLQLIDLGDAEGETRDEMFTNAEKMAYDITKAGKFFIMLGGDHSVTIPVHKGVDKALDGPLGIIHIDAHFDLSDEMGGDKLSHGSTERRALELKNVSGTEALCFLGIRNIELEDVEFIANNKTPCINAVEMSNIGIDETVRRVKEQFKDYKYIYLTLDIDCLDPAYAPGTGTPQFGGLTARELLELLRGIFELPIIGMDIVEVAPGLDDSLLSVFAARKIIIECWGHHLRKIDRV